MASRRQLILTALATLLETITIADGFNTDAGNNVMLGQDVELGDNDPDAAILISPLTERFVPNQTKLYSEWPLSIKAVVKKFDDLDDSWIAVEQIIEDIQKAVEVADRTLGGLVNWNGSHGLILDSITALQREAGSNTVGMEVTYLAKLQRAWGIPTVET